MNASLDAAKHNLKAAGYNLNGGYWDTAFKSAYDGLLQISRVILLLNGYQPDDGEQHKNKSLPNFPRRRITKTNFSPSELN